MPAKLGQVFVGSHMGGSSCLVLHGTCAKGRGEGYRVFTGCLLQVNRWSFMGIKKSAHINTMCFVKDVPHSE